MSDTLANMRQVLLPLAQHLGYDDIQVGADLNKYGYNYWVSAHAPHRITTLANIIDHETPESAINAAWVVLCAEYGSFATL